MSFLNSISVRQQRLMRCFQGAILCLVTFGGGVRASEPLDVRRDATVAAIEAVMPTVVNISTETIVEVRDPFEGLFREFFGPNWGRRPQQSLGSGVIIDEEGYILTNLHVVRRASRITVTLADGRVYEAKWLVGTAKSDVALLKLVTTNNERFTAIKFAPDDDLLLGETVLALGNPFGLGGSVTRGILSSKARRPVSTDDESLDIADWLQTDAAINPGNSGGPLINLRGELIGLNVAIFRDAQGIGFAIPVKRISEALAAIFTPERIQGLWFGAVVEPDGTRIVVRSIDPSSPADKAGLHPGDVILAINDRKPGTVIDFNRHLVKSAERAARIVVERNGARKTLDVRMVPESEFFNATLFRQKLGLSVQELTPELSAALRLRRIQGLLISDVETNSPADRAQLRPSDVIQAIDGVPAADMVEAARALHQKKKGETVLLELLARRASRGFVEIFSTRIELAVR